MIWTFALRALSACPTPVMVPPVPTPATKCEMRPRVWRQISGPVVCSCASGLAAFEYWSGRNAPGVSRTSRSAVEYYERGSSGGTAVGQTTTSAPYERNSAIFSSLILSLITKMHR